MTNITIVGKIYGKLREAKTKSGVPFVGFQVLSLSPGAPGSTMRNYIDVEAYGEKNIERVRVNECNMVVINGTLTVKRWKEEEINKWMSRSSVTMSRISPVFIDEEGGTIRTKIGDKVDDIPF